MTFMFGYPLGDDATLGMLEPWHAEQFADAVERARDHLTPWIPFSHRITDVDSARELLQRLANDHANDARHFYGIWRNNKIIGGAVFGTFDATNGLCELGVWLTPEAQGHGLITRTARYLIDWAILERGIRRVSWHTDPRNTRSKAVAQRLGMTFEGVLRSSHPIGGVRQDQEVWALLADEWRTEPPKADDDSIRFASSDGTDPADR